MALRLLGLLIIGSVAGATFIGCGDDDDSTAASNSSAVTVTTASLTRPKFVSSANAICSKERRQIATRVLALEEQGGGGNQTKAEAYTDTVKVALLPTFQSEVDWITKLGAPAGEEKNVEAMLTAEQEALDRLEADESIASIDEVAKEFTKANKSMKSFGLLNCLVVAEP